MTLFELAITSFMYRHLTDFDRSLEDFRKDVAKQPDLLNAEHRANLLRWLNQWGCRQFALEHHQVASCNILDWYNEHRNSLPSETRSLLQLSKEEIEALRNAYSDLTQKIASYRITKKGNQEIRIGPTGASKVLFAILPEACVAWDEAMRKRLKYDGSPDSYIRFLERIKLDMKNLHDACREQGIRSKDLPGKLDRPSATLAQLCGEYYWVTITRGCDSQAINELKRWALQRDH